MKIQYEIKMSICHQGTVELPDDEVAAMTDKEIRDHIEIDMDVIDDLNDYGDREVQYVTFCKDD